MTEQANLFAGMGSHQSAKPKTETWFTPPAIIEAVGGPESFDLDPCSPAIRPWATARNHYTPRQNGLLMPWFGRVWLNPPYTVTVISLFLGRMVEHGRGISLIFARTETEHFRRFVWDFASGLLFLHGRLHFHHTDGRRAKANCGAPSVLIAYGDEDRDVLAAAPIDGAFVPLRLPTTMVIGALSKTWSQALAQWFSHRDGPVSLADIYRAFRNHPKTHGKQHWRAKLRQALQRGEYERVERGIWQRRTA